MPSQEEIVEQFLGPKPDDRSLVLEALKAATTRTDEPRPLSSGLLSHYFVDVKKALSCDALSFAGQLFMKELIASPGPIGGPSTGADPLSITLSLFTGRPWFFIQKDGRTEGANLLGRKVTLVDDVYTTGCSLIEAEAAVWDAGGEVQEALVLVSRSKHLPATIMAIFSYEDLGIPAIEDEQD